MEHQVRNPQAAWLLIILRILGVNSPKVSSAPRSRTRRLSAMKNIWLPTKFKLHLQNPLPAIVRQLKAFQVALKYLTTVLVYCSSSLAVAPD